MEAVTRMTIVWASPGLVSPCLGSSRLVCIGGAPLAPRCAVSHAAPHSVQQSAPQPMCLMLPRGHRLAVDCGTVISWSLTHSHSALVIWEHGAPLRCHRHSQMTLDVMSTHW